MKPFDPENETGIQYIARLEETVNRLLAERRRLDKRIHNQRVALRENWETIEKRAQYKKAWYPSPLLTQLLKRTWNRPQPWWRRLLATMARS